jgi:hypothetical protein
MRPTAIALGAPRRIPVFALLFSLSIPAIGFGGPQEAPMLTDTIHCTVEHALGCSWQKTDCIDGDSVLEDIAAGTPTYYRLDLAKRIGHLEGKDEQGTMVQILRIGFAPGPGIVNVQGINEGWMPWTLSYELANGNGFVTETTPEFTSLYKVHCDVPDAES